MKYFTPQLWIGFNSPRSKAAFKTWDVRLKAYRQNLEKVLPGLSLQAQRFFRNALILHDGTLTRMEVGDRIGNIDGKTGRDIVNRRGAVVRLFVLSDRVDQHCYILEYKNLKRVELNFPGKIALFPVGMYSNFGDWGYDELTLPEKGLFRHEILFSSGATIAIDFRKISVQRKRAR
jgi:hypothetical protein